MPKLLRARPPRDRQEERQVRKLAGARHAPGDWIQHAQIIMLSWEGMPGPAIASQVGCHPETVHCRLRRAGTESLDGLGDRPGTGRTHHPGRALAAHRTGREHPAGQAALARVGRTGSR
ncbi:hypothetical protein GCM10010466_35210 [Planomonospora alba]|uniref:Uncharacterized protein n=1 Tax=Planomonospora alba TaxID=161354 RepID=A0ABP6N9V9_9ACTN